MTSTGFRRVTVLPDICNEKGLKTLGPSHGFVVIDKGQFILKELVINGKLFKGAWGQAYNF